MLPPAAFAQWPTVGGNSLRNGQNLDVTGPESEASLLWTDSDHPCWFGGQIYTEDDVIVSMRFNGIDLTPLVAMDAATGEELWTRNFTGQQARSLPIGFRDGQIYALKLQELGHDTLFALDPADGATIWTAEVPLHQGIVASAAYADNGDLIVNAVSPTYSNALTRLDHTNGEVVWQTDRILSVVGGSEHVCVYGDKIYGWKGAIGQVRFTAWDVETGADLYDIGLPGDGDQEIPFSVAPDGTIYIIRDGGDLFALDDTGSGFSIRWQETILFGDIAPVGCHFAVTPDGDVIVPAAYQLARFSAEDGTLMATSIPLTNENYMAYPRFALDSEGTLYCGSGTYDGDLIALDPETLEIRWFYSVPNMVYGGPAVGPDGNIYVAGGTNILCFEGQGVPNQPPSDFALLFPANEAHIPDSDFNHTIPFDWEDSVDPDPGDTLSYILVLDHRDHPNDDLIVSNDLTESEFTFDDNLFALNDWEYDESFMYILWSVTAADGRHTVMAGNAPFELDYELSQSVDETQHFAPPLNDLLIYPNPANAQATVAVTLARPSNVTLTVSDLLGRQVLALPQGTLAPGLNHLPLDFTAYPSGTYLVRVGGGHDFSQTGRLVIVK